MAVRDGMTSRWQVGRPDHAEFAVVHHDHHFLRSDQGFVHTSADWEKRLPQGIAQPIGYWQQRAVQVVELPSAVELSGCQWVSLRQIMLEEAYDLFAMLGYAHQIALWARHHRFCGQCGSRTEPAAEQHLLHCPVCGLHQYPKLAPSMIVLVTRGDEILLARSKRFASGMYSTLAGYVEPGESVEQCVHREVMEEVGLSVDHLHYLGSQNWPFPHSLMLGFHARYAGGEIRIQEDEIEDARWFSVEALPPLPVPRTIARFLIESYLAQHRGLPEPMLPGSGQPQ